MEIATRVFLNDQKLIQWSGQTHIANGWQHKQLLTSSKVSTRKHKHSAVVSLSVLHKQTNKHFPTNTGKPHRPNIYWKALVTVWNTFNICLQVIIQKCANLLVALDPQLQVHATRSLLRCWGVINLIAPGAMLTLQNMEISRDVRYHLFSWPIPVINLE